MATSNPLELPALDAQMTVRSRVTEALRNALVAGEMEPGEVYSAPSLAAMLGVSATPVREAMLDLTREGLIETVRNQGFRDTTLSPRDLDEIAALRSLIEVPTIGDVARVARVDDLQALRPLADDIVGAAKAGDLIAFIRADTSFHLQLLALAGNRTLVNEIAQLRSRSRLYGLRELAEEGRLTATALEHTQLLDLLENRDG
ncbi:MAG: GntR family transcriptional regulator, partial [Pseudonocardiaceae bacterium]